MQDQSAPVYAAIDIGSNTIRTVVARWLSGNLDILDSGEALVRIGESVNATGAISEEKQTQTIDVLRQFQSLAHKYAAKHILATATEAIRKASNKDTFLSAIKEGTDIDVQLIDGSVEAFLTFYGTTYKLNKEPHPPASVGVIDLGGGSTELVLAKHMQVSWYTSLPVGSGWLYDRYITSDPPSDADRIAACSFLQTYLRGLHIKRFPSVCFATGGSANTLLRLAQQAFSSDDSNTVLTHDDLIRCEGLLWALPAKEIANRYRLDEKRARILSAGVLIIRMIMETFALNEIHVSAAGIREGGVLAYAWYGDRWMQAIQQKVSIADIAVDQDQAERTISAYSEPFVQSGRRLFRERAEYMLSWRNEVLKHEDIEAIHKMRVASRRLRAVMDAYQSICEPKVFKAAYRQVKELADMLGEARDTDVMMDNLRNRIEQVPPMQQEGMRWLVASLAEYREEHQRKLERYLKQLPEDEVMRQLEACFAEGGSHSNGEG